MTPTRSCRRPGDRAWMWVRRRVGVVTWLATTAAACTPGADAARGASLDAALMTTTPTRQAANAATLRVALNEHLRTVLARSSVKLDPAQLGDAAVVLITEPTSVVYDDPRDPRLDFRLGVGRFVAIDQAAGWVYGLNVTSQLRATSIDEAVAAARAVERDLGATAWQRDVNAPWRASEDTIRTWMQGDDAELPIARFTAGPAELRITLKRTGNPTPSERLRGNTAETFYVNVGATDLERLDAYEARVLRERKARGGGSVPLPLTTFMNDTSSP